MKTRKAFALKDFDEEKILQRSYFKSFNLPNASDAEILESLQATGDDTISEMEQKLNQLQSLLKRVQEFKKLIERHISRYEKIETYINAVMKLPANAKIFLKPAEYAAADNKVFKLIAKAQMQHNQINKNIQARYRKQFTANLRKFLKASGLNQKELGELIHISPQAMSQYVLGKRDVPTHTLIRLAKILNISADKLLGIE